MNRDFDWAEQMLCKFVELLDEYENCQEVMRLADRWDDPQQTQALTDLWDDVTRLHGVATALVADLLPGVEWPEPKVTKANALRSAAQQAIGALQHRLDLEAHWPTMPVIEIRTHELHPWVWNAARDLWASEHWGEAVEAAVKVVNVKLQDRSSRRDLSGTPLVRQVFSLKNPILKVMADDGSPTYKSVQEGAMHLGEAVFMYWRNALAHEPGGAAPQEAVEALGAVSTLARLIDNSLITSS